MDQLNIRTGGAGRPRSGESVSGDAWTVHWLDGACRIALVDGAGHGAQAAKAASAALEVLDQDRSSDLARLLTRCHHALAHSRGAVMTIALVEAAGRLLIAGIGNIEAHLWRSGEDRRVMSQRGMLGSNLRTIRPLEFTLAGEWRLVLHSDGVSGRFGLSDPSLDELARHGPTALAEAILERHARPDDDATVVAVFGGA